jgi:hypothetical protein
MEQESKLDTDIYDWQPSCSSTLLANISMLLSTRSQAAILPKKPSTIHKQWVNFLFDF